MQNQIILDTQHGKKNALLLVYISTVLLINQSQLNGLTEALLLLSLAFPHADTDYFAICLSASVKVTSFLFIFGRCTTAKFYLQKVATCQGHLFFKVDNFAIS